MDNPGSEGRSQTIKTAASSGAPRWLDSLSPEMAGKLVLGSSDLVLILDDHGIIRDVAVSHPELKREGCELWRGQAWIDTVTLDSRDKVRDLLEALSKDQASKAPASSLRPREINHMTGAGPDLSIRYTAMRLEPEGLIIALGRDLRATSALQQRLVEAQQAMEREYARLRFAETRYRMLFQLASEPVIILEAGSLKIVELNPAAQRLIPSPGEKLLNMPLPSAFMPESADMLEAALKSARIAGRSAEIEVVAHGGGTFGVLASLFRQDNAAFLLVRLTPVLTESASPLRHAAMRVLNVIERLPDAFVVVDPALKIIEANQAFLDLAQLGAKQQALGEPLERWLGRPGVDMAMLLSNLGEYGVVRNFATIMRGAFGSVEEVELSAVPALSGEVPSYGFVMRSTGVRVAIDSQRGRALPRSVEHLTELIGRVSLKEMVRETTDVIERLCIEAALELSKDNRASAAQMLGLSRQSFYAKMRRHGLGDLEPEEGELN